MRKIISTLFVGLFALATFGQEAKKATPVIIPGAGKIDVEKAGKAFDTKADISNLSLSELRVLRNAIPARKGYCFMDAELRSVFNRTTWYNDTMYGRWEQSLTDDVPITYTQKETDYMARLKAREDELRKNNFVGTRPNLANLVNPYQIEVMPEALKAKLEANGFAIAQNEYEQLFHVYEKNDYYDFPSFVTTDIFLQAFHIYFDCLTRKLEQRDLYERMTRMSWLGYTYLMQHAAKAKSAAYRDAALYDAAYFAIAHQLFTGTDSLPAPKGYEQMIKQEVVNVKAAQTTTSQFLDFTDAPFIYDIYKPRGHYTRCDSLSRYFQGMMWLQNVPFIIDDQNSLRRAVVMADFHNNDEEYSYWIRSINEKLTFLMGKPDNVSLDDLAQVLKANLTKGESIEALIANKKQMKAIMATMLEKSKKQMRIVPKNPAYSIYRLNFMPQRYLPDAEVLQEMVDYKNNPTQRAVPSGLDFFAAMGNSRALDILNNETQAPTWSDFAAQMQRMQDLMQQTSWDGSFATLWLKALDHVANHTKQGVNYPYFMLTPQWQKKELNTALASWAELKHDAILYAKQPMGAECGDAGPPAPEVKGYVEPNIGFWEAAEQILEKAKTFTYDSESLTDIRESTDKLIDMATFLHRISMKEMVGQNPTYEEYCQLSYIGATFENMSLNMLRDPDEYLQQWSDVSGTDRSVALVADVYTANADNNPDKSVLYGAVGPADEIYVVIEVNGYLYLMRGAVLSYREFTQPLAAPRLTDEDWQQQLKTAPRYGVPSWMDEITVPQTEAPKENELIFYGTGC